MKTANRAERDFREVLQEEFLARCRKNPQYSVRSFARSLRIAPSALSEMIRGTRPITRKMTVRLGLALGLTLDQIEGRAPARGEVIRFEQITLDTYAVVSDWYHYAILELIKVKGFKGDVRWIARRLALPVPEARIAIERLQKTGLLEITQDGKWIDKAGAFATNISGDLTSEGSRKLQKQVLEKSIRALEELPTSERNHTSMTMAIHPDALPEAIERIKNFRRELTAFLESHPAPTEVYNLGISLYPVTKSLKDTKGNQS